MTKEGKIIRIISNLYTVISDNNIYECRARGKFRNDKVTPCVGDFVVFDYEKKYIEKIKERKNILKRPYVSNIDIAIVLTSVKEPNLSLNLLDRQLALIISNNIKPIIVLSKIDLLNNNEKEEITKIFNYYKSIGINVLTNNELDKLIDIIKDKVVVLTGQTGAGKSTLINKLDASFNLKTNKISKALGRGVHTTRHTQLYNIKGAYIVDTPGFSSLDLNIDKTKLKDMYPEFNVTCKFKDCQHDKEIGCKVKELVEKNKILKSRYDNYIKIRSELNEISYFNTNK